MSTLIYYFLIGVELLIIHLFCCPISW